MSHADRPLADLEYRALARFRFTLRKFLAFSERALRHAGLPPRQYQALLALRGIPAGTPPTVGALAAQLLIRHHSAVALADRLEHRGLVARRRGREDQREVLLGLTGKGERSLARMARMHRAELAGIGPELQRSLETLLRTMAGRRGVAA